MRNIITVIVILITCACSRKENNQKKNPTDIKTINIFRSQSDSLIKNLSFLASDIRHFQLKTPGNISFECIYKIVTSHANIFVNTGKDLLCFDNLGQFLYSLSQKDKASLEFIWDFDISSDQGTLVILNYGKILFYDIIDNKFVYLKSIKLNQPTPSKISFVPETDKILLSVFPRKGNEKSLSILISSNGDTLNLKRNHYYNQLTSISEESIIQFRTENNLCFKEQYSDTVFYVDNKSDTIKTCYILDSNGSSLIDWVKGDGKYAYDRMSPYSTIESIFEVSNFIIYNYAYHYPIEQFIQYHKIISNKTTGKKYEIDINNDLKDDLSGGPDFFPFAVSEGKLYSWTYGFELKEFLANDSLEKVKVQNQAQKENLKKLSDSLNNLDIILIEATPN